MKKLYLVLLVIGLLFGITACNSSNININSNNEKDILDPYNPVTLTVWHYYHGPQQIAFDKMVEDFNNTQGLEKGIIIEAFSYGGIKELADAVIASANNEIGSKPLPDIFASYGDTAFKLDNMQKLANIDEYITAEELSLYIDSYIEEGRINTDNLLKIFPIAKSSEIGMLNKTDFDLFVASANGISVSYNDLKTFEGIVTTAAKYYDYTDKLTAQVLNDGKAFFGLDSIANFFNIYAKQQEKEIITVKDGKPSIGYDKELMRKIWDFYYVNIVKGHFAANGQFRSDDTKTGDIIYFIGHTTGSAYFPTQVTNADGDSHNVELMTFNMPVPIGGKRIAVQQGAGMCVVKSEKRNEYAAVMFLKWFTQPDRNAGFAINSAGYNAVMKSAVSGNLLQTKMKEIGNEIKGEEAAKVYKNNMMVMKTFTDQNNAYELFALKPFFTSNEVRSVFDEFGKYSVSAANAAKNEIAAGNSYYDVISKYCSDEEFEKWFEAFESKIKKLIE